MPHTLIRLSIDAYLGTDKNLKPEIDPYISPMVASEEVNKLSRKFTFKMSDY